MEINLPYVPESAYTMHMLTGDDPALNNIDEEVVTVETTKHEGMKKAFRFSMPPYSVAVLENNAQ